MDFEEKQEEKVELKAAPADPAVDPAVSPQVSAADPARYNSANTELVIEGPKVEPPMPPKARRPDKPPKKTRPKPPPALPFGKLTFTIILLVALAWFGPSISLARLKVLADISKSTNPKQMVEVRVAYADALQASKGAEAALPDAINCLDDCKKAFGDNDARTAYAKLSYSRLLLNTGSTDYSSFRPAFAAGRWELAKQLWSDAIKTLASGENQKSAPENTTETLQKLADYHFNWGEYDERIIDGADSPAKQKEGQAQTREFYQSALALYHASLARWDNCPGCGSKTNVWADVSECYAGLKDYKNAAIYMKMALEKTLQHGDTEYNVYRYERIATFLRNTGNFEEALKYASDGADMAKRHLPRENDFRRAAERELRLIKRELKVDKAVKEINEDRKQKGLPINTKVRHNSFGVKPSAASDVASFPVQKKEGKK